MTNEGKGDGIDSKGFDYDALVEESLKNVVKKVLACGNKNILLTERGTSFGYNTLVYDMRSIPQMAELGFPVIFDATHSVQQPGGMGLTSGGQREFVPALSRAAVSIGVSGLFIEVHENPDNAPSDGPNMLKLSQLKEMLSRYKSLYIVHLIEIQEYKFLQKIS